MLDHLKKLFIRELGRLRNEISLYKDESRLWIVSGEINNSAGNLCLHLIGNLNHYLGHGIVENNYIRDRKHEFSGKNIPRKALLEGINGTEKVVVEALSQIDQKSLNDDFPMVIWDKPTNMSFTLIHLYGHLNYHLGQINYHRRLLDK